MTNHKIIYSHGFGVQKDDRGLFTDIANAFPDSDHVMFDYNEVNEEENILVSALFSEQVSRLNSIIEAELSKDSNSTYDLICHSQGCVTAALLKPLNFRNVVFLAPPISLGVERMRKVFEGRKGTNIDTNSESVLMRADGSKTIVPKEYWAEIEDINPIKIYNEFAKTADLTLIWAKQDEVLGDIDFSDLQKSIKVIKLDADHNFMNSSRSELVNLLTDLLE